MVPPMMVNIGYNCVGPAPYVQVGGKPSSSTTLRTRVSMGTARNSLRQIDIMEAG